MSSADLQQLECGSSSWIWALYCQVSLDSTSSVRKVIPFSCIGQESCFWWEEGKKKSTDLSNFLVSSLFYYPFGKLTSVTFHFINTKEQSLVFGNFFPFAFATVIAYYQVADSMHVFSSLFCPPQAILGFSQDSSCLVTADHGFTR